MLLHLFFMTTLVPFKLHVIGMDYELMKHTLCGLHYLIVEQSTIRISGCQLLYQGSNLRKMRISYPFEH
jgi:hypothetical protein